LIDCSLIECPRLALGRPSTWWIDPQHIDRARVLNAAHLPDCYVHTRVAVASRHVSRTASDVLSRNWHMKERAVAEMVSVTYSHCEFIANCCRASSRCSRRLRRSASRASTTCWRHATSGHMPADDSPTHAHARLVDSPKARNVVIVIVHMSLSLSCYLSSLSMLFYYLVQNEFGRASF